MIELTRDDLCLLYLSIPYEFQNQSIRNSIDEFWGSQNLDSLIEASLSSYTHLAVYDNLRRRGVTNSANEFTLNFWDHYSKLQADLSINTFSDLSMDYALLKAQNIFISIAPSYREYRYAADVDVLFRKDVAFVVRDILLDHDFISAKINRCKLVKAEVDIQLEESHYELSPLLKIIPLKKMYSDISEDQKRILEINKMPVFRDGNEMYFGLKVDLHKNISLDTSVESVWGQYLVKSDDHKFVHVFSVEDLFWYIALKLYYEVHTDDDRPVLHRLRNLIDLYVIVYSGKLDWAKFLERINRINIEWPIFYVLEVLREVFKLDISEQLISDLRDQALKKNKRSSSYGEFLSKLMGKKPSVIFRMV